MLYAPILFYRTRKATPEDFPYKQTKEQAGNSQLAQKTTSLIPCQIGFEPYHHPIAIFRYPELPRTQSSPGSSQQRDPTNK